MAPLCFTAKFDPFLSYPWIVPPSTLAQSEERVGSNFAIWQPWSRWWRGGRRCVGGGVIHLGTEGQKEVEERVGFAGEKRLIGEDPDWQGAPVEADVIHGAERRETGDGGHASIEVASLIHFPSHSQPLCLCNVVRSCNQLQRSGLRESHLHTLRRFYYFSSWFSRLNSLSRYISIKSIITAMAMII